MQKLLAAYAAAPTLNAAVRLRNYDLKHPFASCLLTFEEKEILDSAVRHVKAAAK